MYIKKKNLFTKSVGILITLFIKYQNSSQIIDLEY